jgi:hypothetical protein
MGREQDSTRDVPGWGHEGFAGLPRWRSVERIGRFLFSAAGLGVRAPPDRARTPINDDLVFLFRRGLAEISTLPQLLARICRRLQTTYPPIPKADRRGRGFALPKSRAYARLNGRLTSSRSILFDLEGPRRIMLCLT